MQLVLQTKALADETRLRLLGILAHHELNVGEIVQVLDMGQSRISRHLKILMEAGLLDCKRDGLWAFYSIPGAGQAQPLLQAVLGELKSLPDHDRDLDCATQVLAERRQSTVRFFDDLAADWTRMSREILGDFDLGQAILGYLHEPGTVVDLGCGPGLLLGRLAEKANRAIGVDNSARMLEAAARLLSPCAQISLRLGDLEHLPLRDAEADTAILSMVLHHLASPQAGLAEMSRVMLPGGQVILVDFLAHTNETMRTRYGDRWLGFAVEDLRLWLRQSGFQPEREDHVSINLGLDLLLLTARRV